MRALLERLGFPDPVATAAQLDEGLGEVRFTSPVANVRLTFYLDAQESWWLFLVRYGPRTPELPLELAPPHGFSLHDDRDMQSRRHGPPQGRGMMPVDRWEIGPIVAFAGYDRATNLPRYIEFWPRDVIRRS